MKNKLFPLFMLFFSVSSFSSDYGVVGEVFTIKERDLIEVMKEEAQKKVDDGSVDILNKQFKKKSLSSAKRPEGIMLPRADKYRVTQIIPRYTLDRNIKDEKGNILFKKGTVVNPLDIKPLTKTVCFFNADDETQVRWIKDFCSKNPLNKLIVTHGDYEKASKEIGARVYFDQKGFMAQKLNIMAVPAVLRQGVTKTGKRALYVEEFTTENN